MFLSTTTLNQQACRQDFFCQINDLEQAFAFLDLIVSNGDTLVKANLVDQGSRLNLPVDAFDGESVCTHLVLLKEEWERILAQPIKHLEKPLVTHELHQRLRTVCKTREEDLRRKLDMMQHLWQTAQENLSASHRKQQLVRHYQLIINQTADSLRKLHAQFATRPIY